MRCLLPTFPLVSTSRSHTTSVPWLPSVLGLEKNSCVQSASPGTAGISADKLAREFFQRFCCCYGVSHFSAAMYGHFISTRPSGSGVPGMDTSPSGLQARHGFCESTTSPERVIVACLFETYKNRRYSCLASSSCDRPHLESIQWSGIERCLYTALATGVVGLRFAIIPKLDAVRRKRLWWYHVELSAWSLVPLSTFIISRLLTLILKFCDTSVEGLGRLLRMVWLVSKSLRKNNQAGAQVHNRVLWYCMVVIVCWIIMLHSVLGLTITWGPGQLAGASFWKHEFAWSLRTFWSSIGESHC